MKSTDQPWVTLLIVCKIEDYLLIQDQNTNIHNDNLEKANLLEAVYVTFCYLPQFGQDPMPGYVVLIILSM